MKKRMNEEVKFYSTLVVLAALALSLVFPAQTKIQAAAPPEKTNELKKADYGKKPLLFEKNKGQIDKQAKFISRGAGYTLYLAKTEAVFSLKTDDQTDILRMKFAGANNATAIEGIDEAVTKTNYYIGKKKFENVPNYVRANYKNLYNGIDAVFYGNQDNQLEYDFVVAPNADVNQITLDFDGAENIAVNENGSLVVKTINTELVQQKPFAYQIIDDEKREVASRYVLSNENTVKFELGEYDETKTLVIDPALSYLTYLGGSDAESVTDIKVDAAGNAFIAGSSRSTNFPGPNSGSGNTLFAAFVSKMSPDGQTVLYTTFLDGEDNDGQNAFNLGVVRPDLAIDSGGNVYVAGGTDSPDFPTTSNAFQRNASCSRCLFNEEGFVTKLDSLGRVVYSTYLGGRNSDYLHSIAVDPAGRAYVTGGTYSGTTFPTKNQFQGTGFFGTRIDAFLTVFNSDGSDILYSTGLGGSDADQGNEIALDSSNNVYIVGSTLSSANSFPLRNSFQSANAGGRDTFVAKFNTSLSGDSSLIYSTFIGGGGTDEGFGIAVDELNQAYITGITGSFNFPLQNAFRSTNQINEAFVTILNSTGNGLVNSSFLGGSNQDEGRDITLGNGGLIYVAGSTLSTDFPTAEPFQAANAGNRDAFVAKIRFPTGVITSSFLGGNGFDEGDGIAVRGNRILVTGFTGSTNLATTSGVFQSNPGANSNNSDGFVAKIIDTQTDSVGVFRPSSTFILTQSTTNIAAQPALSTSALAGQKGVSGDWDGDGMTTLGSFTNGTWKIRNSLVTAVIFGQPVGVRTITFGAGNDLPVVGDWNGDGIDTPGVFRPSTGQFTLTNSTSDNPSFFAFVIKVNFGVAGDLPIAGDWDGDGKDTIAVFRPSTGETFFTNQNILNPPIDLVAFIGLNGDLPIAGDWNGDGTDSLGIYRPSTTEFFLSDDNINLRPVFLFGQTGDQPIAGDWDGKPNP